MSLISLENHRLAAHHFAFLRALAEGVPVPQAAQRYLRIEGQAEASAAHKSLIDQVQALARRQRDKRWRLVGIEISTQAPSPAPSIDDWAAEQGLDGWSHEELQDLYTQQFGSPSAAARRRAARNERLRQQRLQLLRDLEGAAGAAPQASDPLEGWLAPALAERLCDLGFRTLGDLQALIARDSRWWRALRGFGPVKAARLARHVQVLLGESAQRPALPLTFPAPSAAPLSGNAGTNRAAHGACAIAAANDREAIGSWVAARAGSPHTAAQYEREAERFLLWCAIERHKPLSSAAPEDCRAYMDFLGNVPAAWISRRKVARLTPGWAPFKGQLSHASRALALAALHSLFSWLVHARYLASNPWALVNRKLGDDPRADSDVTSRAFTPEVWTALHRHLQERAPTPSSRRLAWLLTFAEATGLRAQEILSAKRVDFRTSESGWVLHVHGKGRRNRTVPVPSVALQATQMYFKQRGLDFGTARPDTPLLASLTQPTEGISYRALHETFTRLVRRVAADLPLAQRSPAERASSHWLRHTHATRAVERQVLLDVLQENLGQSDPRTTARYYRAQITRRQKALERAFGQADPC